MFLRSILLLALCAASLSPASARIADVVCYERGQLETRLKQRFGAEKQGQGLRGPDAVLEVWIAPGNGDWTLVQSYADGTSCIVAMGEHWQDLAKDADPA